MATKTKTKDQSALSRNASLVKALAHPLRATILAKFDEAPPEGKKQREWSPSDLAEVLDAPLGNVSYHIRELAKLGFLKIARRASRRGAVEHYYVSTGRKWDGLVRAEGVEVPLDVLRSFVGNLKSLPADTKVGILVDGEELHVTTDETEAVFSPKVKPRIGARNGSK